jgi:hypothetical protein
MGSPAPPLGRVLTNLSDETPQTLEEKAVAANAAFKKLQEMHRAHQTRRPLSELAGTEPGVYAMGDEPPTPDRSDFVRERFKQIGRGFEELNPDLLPPTTDPYEARRNLREQFFTGASDIMEGAGPFLAPLAYPTMAAEPLATGLGYLYGTAEQKGTEALGEKLGVPPGERRFVSNLVGLTSGVRGEMVGEHLPQMARATSEFAQPYLGKILEPLIRGGEEAVASQTKTLTGERAPGLPVNTMTDLAKWGAALIARGVKGFNEWSTEMLGVTSYGKYGLVNAQNLPKLYEMSLKKFTDHMKSVKPEDFPDTQRLLELYQKGKAGENWYKYSYRELKKYFGPDTDQFIDFLAATSPNNTVPGNLTQALKAYEQWKTSKPLEGFLPVHKGLIEDSLAKRQFGGDEAYKVNSFRQNLMGSKMAVTVDDWIARAFGFFQEKGVKGPGAVTAAQYRFVDFIITQTALKKGIEPRQLQAAIWAAMREEYGKTGGGEPFEEIFKKRLREDPEMRATVEQLTGKAIPYEAGMKAPRVATMEMATRLTPEGNEAADNIAKLRTMDQSDPQVRQLVEEHRQIQLDMMNALGRPQEGLPSLVSQLQSALTGKNRNVDTMISTRGGGTFEGEANINMRVPTRGMDKIDEEAFLAIMGQETDQGAEALSHFDAVEPGVKPATHSVFLFGKNVPIDMDAINNFSNLIKLPVNYEPYPNGVLIDINIGWFKDQKGYKQLTVPEIRKAANTAFAKTPNVTRTITTGNQYRSRFVPREEYQNKIDAWTNRPTRGKRGTIPGENQVGGVGAEGARGGGNTPESVNNVARIRQKVNAASRARDSRYGDWNKRAGKVINPGTPPAPAPPAAGP